MKVELRWLLKLTHLGADLTKFGHKGSVKAPVDPELTWDNAKSAFKTILAEIPELQGIMKLLLPSEINGQS